MDMTIRAMKPDERNYSYSQVISVQKRAGCIGHRRVASVGCGAEV